jgi:arylsulfatase A-like enzyme
MKLLQFIASLALLLIAALGLHAERPNLVVIMTDDLGYADLGFQGSPDIRTPHIDAIARSGVIFTDAYATYSVCAPSRAGFITGRYPQRFGFERNPQYRPNDPNMGLPTSEETIAEVLGKIGYTSGIIGKWHLGAHRDLHPLNRGFDYFFGHLGGGKHYFQDRLTIRSSYAKEAEEGWNSYKTWILRGHEPVKISKYLTDEFSDEAVRFIERSHEQPFFLFLSYNAPHAPLQASEEYLSRYPEIEDPRRRTYAAMVSAVDDGVGQVMDKLKELGLEENTLVFFFSDNGGPTAANASDNSPLRGYKSDVWEGGFRVPFLFSWKGRIEPGQKFSKPISMMDVAGTIYDLTGVAIPPERPLDGVNLMPFLDGKQSGSPHEVIYLRKFDQQRFAVRKGDYKLVIPEQDMRPNLFNLRKDIGERNNISQQNPEVLKELEALRLQWDSELMEPKFLGLIHLNLWGRRPQGDD